MLSGRFEWSVIVALVAALAGGCGTKHTQDSPVGGSTGSGGSAGTIGIGGAAGTSTRTGNGGGAGGSPSPTDAGSDVPMDAPLSATFAAEALAIANEYVAWGRVDDEWRWAPFLCRQPLAGIARPSESNDPSTHGQKLYSVFVKNRDAYPSGPYADQAVVKQSWTAELVSGPDAAFDPASYRPDGGDGGDHFYPYAQGDGGVYRAAAPAGLFIMFKVDPSTLDTDDGWVYATVSPAGQVTSAGRVASCMGCHEVATYERLFGVPKSPL